MPAPAPAPAPSPDDAYSCPPPDWAADLLSASSLECAALRAALGLAPSARLAFSRPRELEQSNVVELAVPDACVPAPRRLLLKRASVSWLKRRFAGNSDERWLVSLRSFDNELAFWRAAALGTAAHARLRAAGCAVPRAWYIGGPAPPPVGDEGEIADTGARVGSGAAANPDTGLGGAARELHVFTSVAELLEPSRHYEVRCFHAHCWRGVAGGDAASLSSPFATGLDALFREGGWWRKSLRPSVDYAALPKVFASHCARLPAYAAVDLRGDDEQLAALRWLAARATTLHAKCAAPPGEPTTLVHGDMKSSNFFFARDCSGGDADTAIDFQWT